MKMKQSSSVTIGVRPKRKRTTDVKLEMTLRVKVIGHVVNTVGARETAAVVSARFFTSVELYVRRKRPLATNAKIPLSVEVREFVVPTVGVRDTTTVISARKRHLLLAHHPPATADILVRAIPLLAHHPPATVDILVRAIQEAAPLLDTVGQAILATILPLRVLTVDTDLVQAIRGTIIPPLLDTVVTLDQVIRDTTTTHPQAKVGIAVLDTHQAAHLRDTLATPVMLQAAHPLATVDMEDQDLQKPSTA
jgi:hypothetical protein